MAYNLTEDSVLRAVNTALQEHLAACKEQVIKDALTDLDKKLRDAAGRIAINLTNYFSVERHGPDLVITIRQEPRGPS